MMVKRVTNVGEDASRMSSAGLHVTRANPREDIVAANEMNSLKHVIKTNWEIPF